MTKQTINVGTDPNDRSGDSLRTAFQKVNANFTELYTQLGLNNDVSLNLGAFEFNGSTLTTTDSSTIIIDQATTVTSDLTVGGVLRTSGLGTISHYPGSTSSLKFEVPAGNNIVLRTAGGDLTFGEDGDLNIPGDILDSTGVNQTAQRVEGSWTVTAGTNTYSFTVPSDGTYVMWVKGNIPNGIITWNATLSVSNSNVPAIGTQYAWNYTGGGSPISLTSIPDQIKGVAGTISTDATYAGTTSNRFDFGISNTSGESQIVYYGYTKI
jgi:hypothetical protein